MNAAEGIFREFDNGALELPGKTVNFSTLAWNNHPVFPGVALKHLVTGKDTGGDFSYHLVRIDPGCAIEHHTHQTQLETHEVVGGRGVCRNNDARLEYRPGVLSMFPAGIPHEVRAGDDGLTLFAKFMPALC